jgi:hypothetical protein
MESKIEQFCEQAIEGQEQKFNISYKYGLFSKSTYVKDRMPVELIKRIGFFTAALTVENLSKKAPISSYTEFHLGNDNDDNTHLGDFIEETSDYHQNELV